MRGVAMVVAMLMASPVAAQGIPGLGSIPGFGQPETPEQKRAFCQRVAGAAASCGLTLNVTALTSCLVRTLPPQDSLRVAQVAERTRGSAGGLLSECGVGLGR
jgi:hypothetical protein